MAGFIAAGHATASIVSETITDLAITVPEARVGTKRMKAHGRAGAASGAALAS